jgi:hypothetical protein
MADGRWLMPIAMTKTHLSQCPLESVDSLAQGFTISFHFFQVVLRNVRLLSCNKEKQATVSKVEPKAISRK